MARGALDVFNYLSLLLISVSALTPTGNHVCMVNERFTTTVRVEEPYQYRRRKTEWCFKIPPRCSKYDMAWSWRWVNKEVEETRQVPKCSMGYVAGPQDNDCRPFCSTPCKHGLCFAPDECQCEAGYQGKICEASCPRGAWGRNCSEVCECKNGAFCDPVEGHCHCAAGWIGRKCDEPCSEGFHGVDCQENCVCGELISCHHITGDCILPTTTTTELISTTEPLFSTTAELTSTTEPVFSTAVQLTSTNEPVTSTTEEISTTTPFFLTLEPSQNTSVTTTDYFTTTTTHSSDSTAVTDFSSASTEFSTVETKAFSEQITTDATPFSTLIDSTSNDVLINSSTWIPYFSTQSTEFIELSEAPTTSYPTEISSDNTPIKPEGEKASGGHELAGLAITIVFSVMGAVVLLIAAAGIALTRHRKMMNSQPQIAITDLGIHKFYGEINIPVKTLFNNPTYNCEEIDLRCEKPVLRTFTPTQDTFDAELREILEAHYDHPPSIVGQLSISVEHLYDEISATYDEAREITAFRTFS